MTLKIVPVKMDEKEKVMFKKARVQAFIEDKRVGSWLSEAIEYYLKHDDKRNT